MFGKKQKRIETLEQGVAFWKRTEEQTQERLEVERAARKSLANELAGIINQNRDYEAHIETLDFALAESKELNRTLNEENKDLVRQVELLDAVLQQLRVNITLPARKK